MRSPKQNRPGRRTAPSYAGGFGLLLVLALLWEGFSRLHVINPIFLPPLTKILSTFAGLVASAELPRAAALTLGRCVAGYLLAAAAAIPVGVLMGQSRTIYRLLDPLIESLRPIPSAAIIPVAILFFGIDDEMKVAVIVFGSLWPILLNTIHGVQIIDPLLIDTGRTLRLDRGQLLWKIILPASLPSIVTGLRISLAISLILSITVEMIAGGSGLGFLILDYERSFKYPEMYSGIIALGVLGVCLNLGFSFIDRRYLAWSKQSASYAA